MRPAVQVCTEISSRRRAICAAIVTARGAEKDRLARGAPSSTQPHVPSPRRCSIASPRFFSSLIWSTGWIVARYSADYADPLTFLCFRFGAAGLLLLGLALAARAPFPRTRRDWVHALVAGVFLHAIYLGGVWWAIRAGLPASVSALIAAVQPIATALLAPALLGERGSWRRSLGVALGLVGLVLVLWPKLSAANIGAGSLTAIGVNILAMLGATAGFFYQKRFRPDRRSARHGRPAICRRPGGHAARRLSARADAYRLELDDGARSRLVGARSVDRRDLAAVAADPPRRGLARLGADLSRAADRGRAGLAAVWRDAERPADRRHGR